MRNKIRRINYRKIYRESIGPIPVDENGVSFDVHHIDGDSSNNSIDNLIAVSVEDHLSIHRQQGDLGACLLIHRRLKSDPRRFGELSAKVQAKRIAEGTHHFLGNSFATEYWKRVRNGDASPPNYDRGARSRGGLSAIARVKVDGWTEEEIAKRVATRKSRNGYACTMSQCHTEAAIAKRTDTRRAKGCFDKSINPLQRKRIIDRLQDVCRVYNCDFTYEFLDWLSKKKVCRIKRATIEKFFSAEEIETGLFKRVPFEGVIA